MKGTATLPAASHKLGWAASAEKEWLRQQGLKDAAKVMGSRGRLNAVLNGKDVVAVLNSGKNPIYRVKLTGDNGGMISSQSGTSMLNSKAFADFFEARPGAPDTFPVATLTGEDKKLFGVAHDQLLLSRMSLDEHKSKHPEVTIADYRKIPEIIRRGEVWGGHANRRYVLLLLDGKPYRAAIKIDAQDQDAWFLSLVISGKQKPPKGAVRLR